MKELFYFSNSDLMIQVQYVDELNTLRYSSHRKITKREKEFVEQYILNNIVANRTEVEEKSTATLSYIGINFSLAKELTQVQQRKPKPDLNFDNGNVDLAIKDLINTSMSNYYFEKIGETIVEYKKNETTPKNNKFKKNLEELVIAYNSYSSKKVKLEKVLPEELC